MFGWKDVRELKKIMVKGETFLKAEKKIKNNGEILIAYLPDL